MGETSSEPWCSPAAARAGRGTSLITTTCGVSTNSSTPGSSLPAAPASKGIRGDWEAAHPLLPSIHAAPVPAARAVLGGSQQRAATPHVPSACSWSGSASWAISLKKNHLDQGFPSSAEQQDSSQGYHQKSLCHHNSSDSDKFR